MTLTYRPGSRPMVVPAEALRHFTSGRIARSAAADSLGRCRFSTPPAATTGPVRRSPARSHGRAPMELAERIPTEMRTGRRRRPRPALREDGSLGSGRPFSASPRPPTEPIRPTPPLRPAQRLQNLEESDRLWSAAVGKTYADMLTADEHGDLVRLVQQRHVLGHQDGLVDADYVAKSGDSRYRVGQRLVVKPPAVLRLCDLVERLATALATLVH